MASLGATLDGVEGAAGLNVTDVAVIEKSGGCATKLRVDLQGSEAQAEASIAALKKKYANAEFEVTRQQ